MSDKKFLGTTICPLFTNERGGYSITIKPEYFDKFKEAMVNIVEKLEPGGVVKVKPVEANKVSAFLEYLTAAELAEIKTRTAEANSNSGL